MNEEDGRIIVRIVAVRIGEVRVQLVKVESQLQVDATLALLQKVPEQETDQIRLVVARFRAAAAVDDSPPPILALWRTHIGFGAVRKGVKVEALVAERALASALVEVLARLRTANQSSHKI